MISDSKKAVNSNYNSGSPFSSTHTYVGSKKKYTNEKKKSTTTTKKVQERNRRRGYVNVIGGIKEYTDF